MKTPYAKYMKDELTDQLVYHALAAREKNEHNRALLVHLSAQERSHYEFWQSLAPEAKIAPNRFMLAAVIAMRVVFGVTFTVKFLELHEEDVIEEYKAVLPSLAPQYQTRLTAIIEDESEHEKSLMNEFKEKRVAYVGFIALGLADAIVEITGVHAGFLGVTGSTLIAGISGVIVGFAAAISMGSAAYLQAKQDPEKSAIASAFVTGVSYLGSVILLALPYFFIRTMLTAFATSTTVGALLLAAFTFYGAVLFDRKFLREFGEAFGLMMGTALATYILGVIVSGVFHVNQNSF